MSPAPHGPQHFCVHSFIHVLLTVLDPPLLTRGLLKHGCLKRHHGWLPATAWREKLPRSLRWPQRIHVPDTRAPSQEGRFMSRCVFTEDVTGCKSASLGPLYHLASYWYLFSTLQEVCPKLTVNYQAEVFDYSPIISFPFNT